MTLEFNFGRYYYVFDDCGAAGKTTAYWADTEFVKIIRAIIAFRTQWKLRLIFVLMGRNRARSDSVIKQEAKELVK